MSESGPTGLKKALTLKDSILFGVGAMLGAGVYAIIGKAAGFSGNMLWLAFIVAAIIAFLTALSYAEFVSRFPDSGGSFEYIKQALGSRIAYVMGVAIYFTGVVAAAAIAISFAEYLSRIVEIPSWIGMVGILVLMGGVNVIGVQSSSGFNMFATAATVVGLLVVVAFAIPDWGSVDLLAPPPDGFFGVLLASSLIFFSYVGFEDLVKMAEETKDAQRVLPKALLISSGIVLIVYVLVAISAVSVLDWKELENSEGPLAAVFETKTARWGAVALAVVALLATSKTILSNILGTSRLLFDIARDSDAGWLKKLAHVMKPFHTPVFAILTVTVLAILFSFIGNLSTVASISNIFILTVFSTVNLSLIVWRLRNSDAMEVPFVVPFTIRGFPILPAIALVVTLGMLGLNVYNIIR